MHLAGLFLNKSSIYNLFQNITIGDVYKISDLIACSVPLYCLIDSLHPIDLVPYHKVSRSQNPCIPIHFVPELWIYCLFALYFFSFIFSLTWCNFSYFVYGISHQFLAICKQHCNTTDNVPNLDNFCSSSNAPHALFPIPVRPLFPTLNFNIFLLLCSFVQSSSPLLLHKHPRFYHPPSMVLGARTVPLPPSSRTT